MSHNTYFFDLDYLSFLYDMPLNKIFEMKHTDNVRDFSAFVRYDSFFLISIYHLRFPPAFLYRWRRVEFFSVYS